MRCVIKDALISVVTKYLDFHSPLVLNPAAKIYLTALVHPIKYLPEGSCMDLLLLHLRSWTRPSDALI
jgi:hypothetical protein